MRPGPLNQIKDNPQFTPGMSALYTGQLKLMPFYRLFNILCHNSISLIPAANFLAHSNTSHSLQAQ